MKASVKRSVVDGVSGRLFGESGLSARPGSYVAPPTMGDMELGRHTSADAPPMRARLSDRVGAALEETRLLERDVRFLEECLPPLQAKLDAAVRPLVDAVIQARRELVALVERRILAAPPRQKRFHREATELLRHLAADLEERFGVVVRTEHAGREDDDEPDEELGSWDHDAWESHAEPAHRPKPETRGRPEPRLDPETAARGIYRSLARELHPDKTTDESERIRRTGLMQDLTEAWSKRDFPNLLRLLHAHGSDEARSDALDEGALQAALRGVEENRDRLRARLRELRHTFLPDGATDWMLLARDPKLFGKALRRAKRIPREELEQMLRLKAIFARSGGLEEFLDEVPWEDWPTVV